MLSGISTACLYPMLLEDSFSTLISMGFRTYEVFINTFSELREDYLKKFRMTADENGCRIYSVHPFTSGYENFLLFSSYERRFEDTLELYRNYFHACNVLGAELFVLHGRRSDKTSISDEEFFERYLRLFRLGRQFGVTVLQENVNLFSSDSPEFIRRMRRACGEECAFVLDIKQAVRGGVDPCEVCGAMGDKVRHIHINDNNTSSDCLLPGFGTMDYPKFLAQLKKTGFNGCLMTEVYRKSFNGSGDLLRAKKTVDDLAKMFTG